MEGVEQNDSDGDNCDVDKVCGGDGSYQADDGGDRVMIGIHEVQRGKEI